MPWPSRHVEDGERLGGWLQKQRRKYKARGWSAAERKARGRLSALSDEEVGRLEAAGVVWDLLAEQWERMHGLLRAYREREGHANVPKQHVEDGERLGGWLDNQPAEALQGAGVERMDAHLGGCARPCYPCDRPSEKPPLVLQQVVKATSRRWERWAAQQQGGAR